MNPSDEVHRFSGTASNPLRINCTPEASYCGLTHKCFMSFDAAEFRELFLID